MLNFFQWLLLTAITGSPLGSLLLLMFAWLLVDRLALGLLPDPLRYIGRRRREGQLTRTLHSNPSDGRARLELASLLLQRGIHRKAVQVLRPNIEAGEDDVQTVFTMGAACMGAGYTAQGEKLLAHAKDLDADFRVGEIDLVLGRERLARGDYAGAQIALQHLLQLRRGSVEGRVLLARAMAKLGDDASAALMRDEAWQEYLEAPRFQRRQERLWAWRAHPSRPVIYAVALLLVLGCIGGVVSQ